MSPAPLGGSFAKLRLEIGCCDRGAVQKLAPFLRSIRVQGINITNKKRDEGLVDCAQALASIVPSSDICVHWSVKQHYVRDQNSTHARLKAFIKDLSQLPGAPLLIVSGAGKGRKYDSLKALQMLQADGFTAASLPVPLHVAFNPYYPEDADLERERGRLAAKLATGLVSGIWLQFGCDAQKLRIGLEFVERSIRELKRDGEHQDVELFGSVLVPSKQLLARMRFRPWYSLFLSEGYLASPEAAEELTLQVLNAYHASGVVPLIETAVANEAQFAKAIGLLEAGSMGTQPEEQVSGAAQGGLETDTPEVKNEARLKRRRIHS